MFIQFFEVNYSVKAVVSRVRQNLITRLGKEEANHMCQVNMKPNGGVYHCVANRRSLYVNVRKNGETLAKILVMPIRKNEKHFRVEIPKKLIQEQVTIIKHRSTKKRTVVWTTAGGRKVVGTEMNGWPHIYFNVYAPLDEKKEEFLAYLIDNALLLGDASA